MTVTSGNQRVVLNFTNWTVTNLTLTLPGALPQISSDAPAGLTTASAVFKGTVLATGASTPSVWLYWGNSDGGTNKGSWSTNVAFGPRGLGSVATNLAGLLGNTTYYYRYYASNSAGGAWSSNSVSFATLQTPPPPPPGLLTHTLTVGVVPIAWQASPGATSYTVKRSLTSGGPYTILQSGVSVTNYTDLLVTNGTVYYYVATATGPGGESGNSGEVAGTPAVIPAMPTGLACQHGLHERVVELEPDALDDGLQREAFAGERRALHADRHGGRTQFRRQHSDEWRDLLLCGVSHEFRR